MKVNNDACIRRNDFIGVGFAISDNSSSILRIGVDRIYGNFEVDCAEALPIQSSLSFSRECDFKNILVESDNLSVII